MFDATLQVIDIQVSAPDPEAEVGPEGGIMTMAWVIGLMLPIGPGQVAPLPAAVIRANVGKDRAIALGAEISEKAETLREPSKLTVATDVDGAIKAAQQAQGLRNGPQR